MAEASMKLVRERRDIVLKKDFLSECVRGHNVMIEKMAEKVRELAHGAGCSSDAVALFRIARELTDEPGYVREYLRTHRQSRNENRLYRYEDDFYVKKRRVPVLPVIVQVDDDAVESTSEEIVEEYDLVNVAEDDIPVENAGNEERATHSHVG